MANEHAAQGDREIGGGPQRQRQPLTGPVLMFDLAAETEQLRRERSWIQGDRNAKVLVKEPSVRVVLTAMKQGARLQEHQTSGQTTIQVLSGNMRVHLADAVAEMAAGHLLVLEPNVAHDVEAVAESVFLLTIAL